MSRDSDGNDPVTTGSQEEMACRELVELVTEYLEGTLAPVEVGRFEAHLEECPWCVRYIEQMRQTIRASGELTEESIPPQARDDLLRTFRDWRSER